MVNDRFYSYAMKNFHANEINILIEFNLGIIELRNINDNVDNDKILFNMSIFPKKFIESVE